MQPRILADFFVSESGFINLLQVEAVDLRQQEGTVYMKSGNRIHVTEEYALIIRDYVLQLLGQISHE